MIAEIHGINCRISDIKDGDSVPVGGSIWSEELTIFVKIDSDKFKKFFEVVAKNAANIATDVNTKNWLNSVAPGVDINMFAHMYAFNNIFKRAFPDAFKNYRQSNQFLSEPRTLSEVVKEGFCTCKEIALLAQLYFQTQNIPTKYVGGQLWKSMNQNNGEQHSFVSFSMNGQDYIYDPANPVHSKDSTNMVAPHILSVDINPEQRQKFEERFKSKKSTFIAAKPVYTAMVNNIWYYGFNDIDIDLEPEFIMNQEKKPLYENYQDRNL